MKPFDLEAAKQGEPIQTRDGRPAEFIAFVPEACKAEQVIALIGNAVFTYFVDGKFRSSERNPQDLLMAPKKRTVWVNLYPGEGSCGGAWHYETKEAADKYAQFDRIGGKAWPLEIEG